MSSTVICRDHSTVVKSRRLLSIVAYCCCVSTVCWCVVCTTRWASRIASLCARQFVKVKVVPSYPAAAEPGVSRAVAALLPAECEYIDGVMFRKVLPHKQMREKIDRPRLLLLDGACGTRNAGGTVALIGPHPHLLRCSACAAPDALEFTGSGDIVKLDTLVEQVRRAPARRGRTSA